MNDQLSFKDKLNLWKCAQGIQWCTGEAREQCIRNLGELTVRLALDLK